MFTPNQEQRLVDDDPLNAPGNLDELETSLKEATAEASADDKNKSTSSEEKVAEKPAWMPDKFWTGNTEESIQKMADGYTNLQSAYGRMANDLGTQRKITDRVLAMDKRSSDLDDGPTGTTPKRSLPKIDPAKLVDNPNEALESYLTERDQLVRQQALVEQQRQTAAQEEAEFVAKYPNYQEIATSAEFREWKDGSPLRQKAVVLAAQGDFQAADALLSEWTTHSTQSAAPNTGGDQLEAARKASTESAAQAAGGSAGKGGRIYRRADLIKLRMERPEQYSDPAFQAEIQRAYAEHRVK